MGWGWRLDAEGDTEYSDQREERCTLQVQRHGSLDSAETKGECTHADVIGSLHIKAPWWAAPVWVGRADWVGHNFGYGNPLRGQSLASLSSKDANATADPYDTNPRNTPARPSGSPDTDWSTLVCEK